MYNPVLAMVTRVQVHELRHKCCTFNHVVCKAGASTCVKRAHMWKYYNESIYIQQPYDLFPVRAYWVNLH